MTTESTGGARNHHFVPQYYLKGFAKPRSKDGKLLVFDLKERKSFATKPRNVAARRDYNRVDIEGVEPNFVESQLSVFEGQADQAFRRIIGARSIENSDDFSFVITLIAQISLTNPLFREHRDKIISEVGSVLMHNMVATPERWEAMTRAATSGEGTPNEPIAYEEVRAAVMNGDIVPRTSKEILIQQEMELWPKILPILQARKWTLLVAPARSTGFATSDRPFSLRWNDEAMNNGFYGVGLGCSDTTLTFPLSRDLALVGSFENGGEIREVNEEAVAVINFITFQAAMRQVYAESDFSIFDVGATVRLFSTSEIWRHVRERRLTSRRSRLAEPQSSLI